MNTKDFKNIMNNAFRVDFQGNDSEVRCFKCNEKSELKRIWTKNKRNRRWTRKWKMVCNNNHRYNLIDWLVEHIDMRDGVAKVILRGDCNYQKVRPD